MLPSTVIIRSPKQNNTQSPPNRDNRFGGLICYMTNMVFHVYSPNFVSNRKINMIFQLYSIAASMRA
jgi:hypothetical protein